MAGGRSKTKAQKAAAEVERWSEQRLIIEAYRRYVELLHRHQLVDFAFLQRRAYDLLTAHPEIVAGLYDHYRAILVDEYQDTNAVQERLLKLLAGDIISEELHGPYGYVDDIWLCAYIANLVRRDLEDDAILIENWDGETPLIPLIQEVLAKEHDLIGDERDKILWYTGCSQLISDSANETSPQTGESPQASSTEKPNIIPL